MALFKVTKKVQRKLLTTVEGDIMRLPDNQMNYKTDLLYDGVEYFVNYVKVEEDNETRWYVDSVSLGNSKITIYKK